MFIKQNNNLKGFIKTSILITTIVSVLIVGGISYIGVKQYKIEKIQKEKAIQEKEEMKITAEDRQKTLEQVQTELEKIKEKNNLVQQTEIDILKKEIEIIKNVKSPEPKVSFSKDINDKLSSIIKKWRPFVVYIECDFRYNDGTFLYTSSGSGLIIAGEYGTIITNKHVISFDNKYAPYVCRIKVPDDDKTISIYGSEQEGGGSVFQNVSSDIDIDAGFISVNRPTQHMINLKQKQPYPLNCSRPSIGDEVIILGYPMVGSKQDITATEGIISGFDGDYFITSAKVEEGNSGGLAISIKDDCYLGIPTYAEIGTVESLARILDFTVVARLIIE